jgi:DNA mismatch repair protein MLH3
MTEIAPLPDQTRSFLRSTVILSSLVQVVSELIQNSLDANARNLDISTDCDEWSCCVQDDGDGISKDNLDIIANSSRHSTSKTYTHSGTFGFRGEGIALTFPDNLIRF